MTAIYLICHADADSGCTVATFVSEAARDALWEAIQAIPWHEKPGYIGYADWKERDVEIGGRFYSDHPKGHTIHGHLYRSQVELLDTLPTVVDVTDRSDEWKRYNPAEEPPLL